MVVVAVSRRDEKLDESGREGSKRGREVDRAENVAVDIPVEALPPPFLADAAAAVDSSSQEESTAPVRPSTRRKARRGYASAMLLRQLRA